MTAFAFWELLAALIGAVIVLRILSWWGWRALVTFSKTLWARIRRFERLRSTANAAGERFPKVSDFLQRRVAPDSFLGLPATLFLFLAGYIVALGAGLLEDLFEDDELSNLDQTINEKLDLLRDPQFLEIFGWITGLGNTETLVAVTLVTLGFLWAHKRYAYIPGLLVAILGAQTITWIGKFAIDRDRPEFLTFATASSPSFPSAHTTGAAAVYGFVAYAIARDLAGERRRFELGFWAIITIALVAFSRAILSVHFASDIAAGLLVGAFWLLAGFAITEYLRERGSS